MAISNKVDTHWFQTRVRLSGLTQRQIANTWGVDPSAVTLSFHGKREIKLSEARKLAELFDVPFAEVAERAGLIIKGDVAGRDGMNMTSAGSVDQKGLVNLKGAGSKERIKIAVPPGGRSLRYRIGGSVVNGWTLIYTPRASVSADAVGRLSVCELSDGRTVVATVQRTHKVGTFTLVPMPTGDEIVTTVISASPVLLIQP